MIPFVWQDYDSNNTYNIDPWQRVNSSEEFTDRALQLRDKSFFENKLEEYLANYSKVLLSQDEYYKLFSEKMNYLLDINN